ncbi:leucine-rich repeat domain-containing protein [Metabacillus litoralis]|uniref:leucine-rich repeat domain-containing protein n=1 Tax=Metabacillus litoralis TaxID=152268 RepID=UPI00203E5EE3|nr:leucine-rich repeat domain-containing protein [Metabacillus litoralis]MCM3653566.1 leucine-rich repeat domain-containing protein [Metabacillus litoralis]
MTKRYVSILLVFILLLAQFIPFLPTAVAASDSMTFLPAVSKEDGIQLQWRTISTSQAEASFTLIKNNEETKISSVEVIESTTDSEGNLVRTYQLVDQQVTSGETYSYAVKKTDDTELQSEPINVTYQQVKEVAEPFEVKVKNVTDQSINVSWSAVQDVDHYQVVLDGKIVDQVAQVTSYELKDLESEQSYSISIRALGNGSMIKEAVVATTTLAAPKIEKVEDQVKEEVREDVKEAVKEEVTEEVTENKETMKLAASEPSGELVTIPDLVLKQAIKAALKLKRDDIYVSDIESLTTLDVSYRGVKDITGLEKATNLTKLELAGNEIKNASALQSLTKLEYLDLSDYEGNNIQFLTSLTNLKTLILSDSSIKGLEPIVELTNLETLDISYTELTTILPLQKLANLATLVVYGDLYFDLFDEVQALEREGLSILHDDGYQMYITSIKANEERVKISWEYEGEDDVDYYEVKVADKVTKVDQAESTTSLTVNELQQNTEYTVEIVAYNDKGEQIGKTFSAFKTLSTPDGEKVVFGDPQLEKAIKAEFGLERDLFVSDMKALEELYLDRKRINDLSGLEAATNLQRLSLSANRITDLTPLAALKNLTELSVDDNPITNFTALKGLTNLTTLTLGATGITDLSVLADLQNLDSLALDRNNLESLATLPALKNLVFLSIYDNNLKSLKGIEKVAQLEYLYADGNPLLSITDIQQLSKIKDVNIAFSALETIDVLLKLEELQYVSLYGNEKLDLNEGSVARQVIEQLEQRGVYVDYEGSEEEEWFEAYIGTVTENSMHVYWDYYGEQEIAKYEVYVNGKLHTSLTGEEFDLKIDKLAPNTEYEVEVKAYNDKKELVKSSTTSETTWGEPTGDKVKFKDDNLKALIKEQLGLERDVRVSDLEKLDFLYLDESDIKDLTGLEYAINLVDFHLGGNAFTLDLAPLKGLKELSSIYIEESPIKSYTMLNELKNLFSLSIVNNNIDDLSFLNGLKNVQDLTLNNNQIQDISVLSSLKRLNSINLANNNIKDLAPLKASSDSLYHLDISENPIEDISSIAQLENLVELILDDTMITNLTPLLDLSSLETVSLYNISTLDLTEAENAQVIEQLKQWGVYVNTEVDMNPELYIDEVTETTISISWDPMLPKGIGSYNLSLYTNDGEETVEEIALDSNETSYQFTNLSPFTDYIVEVNVEEDEYYGYLLAEVTTLPIEGTVKDVSMYVYKTDDVPEADAMFDLHGTDDETENVYYFGGSDDQGRLIDYSSDEELDIFKLPIGNYEIMFLTEDEEEVSFQFEIKGTEDYLKNPIIFVLEESDKGPVTPPSEGGNGEDIEKDKDEQQEPTEPTEPTPSEVNGPVDQVKTDENSKNAKGNNAKGELPNTATETYNLLVVGLIVISLGGIVLFIQKRKRVNNR